MEHTVAAISTAFGRGGIAVIRISGETAFEVSEQVFKVKSNRKLAELTANTAIYGEIVKNGKIIDDGIATVFHAPKSFTGEDMIEISCHGGVLITAKVLEAILEAGANQAGAGEFTRRAFTNGKLSLSQAEAIGLLIDAQSDEQLALASAHERGALRRKLDELDERLKSVVTSIYAGVDFPDEDLALLDDQSIIAELQYLERELSALQSSYEGVRAVTEGIRTCIIGEPNTGKSSLLNRLLGRERAIVTDIAGTTRDTLEESVNIGRVMLRLCDTAGIRESDDAVERIGVERSLEAAMSARLILAVFDGSASRLDVEPELSRILGKSSAVKIAVVNKLDLGAGFTPDGFCHVVHISAKTGEGIDELKTLIESLFSSGEIDYESEAVLLNSRQNASVTRSLGYIRSALGALQGGLSADTAGFDLEAALAELEELDGRRVTEEIVDGIFHRFCVGK